MQVALGQRWLIVFALADRPVEARQPVDTDAIERQYARQQLDAALRAERRTHESSLDFYGAASWLRR